MPDRVFSFCTSLATGFPVPERSKLWHCIPRIAGLFDTPESSIGDRFAFFDTKLIIGFDFAPLLLLLQVFLLVASSTWSWICQLIWHGCRKKTEKLITLNKHKRWFHSSRVKLPSVNKSASWFLVSTYLIWILESQLILSNDQSSATLCVRDTCLIVGLLPFSDHQGHCYVVFSNVKHGLEWQGFALVTT